jgi:hypothetical protein
MYLNPFQMPEITGKIKLCTTPLKNQTLQTRNFEEVLKEKYSQVPVAHIYNPNYSGSRD